MGSVQESLSDSKTAMAEAFRNRNLRRLNLAFAGSVIGDWAYAVGMSVYAYTRGGATAVGVLAVVRYVSMALLSPFTSLLADRFDRRRVMVIADLLRVALVGVAAIVVAVDGPPLVVYVLGLCTAAVGTAFRPAQAALLPSLANHPGELSAANVAASTIESVGFFAGPAIGGLLLAVSGNGAVFAFDAVTFAWSAVMVWGLKPAVETRSVSSMPEPPEISGARTNPFAGVGVGFGEIFRDRDIRLLVGLFCAQTVIAGASSVAVVAIALDLLKLGNGGLGTLNATMGVGGILGGFIALGLSQRGRLAWDFGWGVLLWAAPFLLVAAWPTTGGAVMALALMGVGNSIVDVNAFPILQRLVSDAVMGRVFGALESALVGGMAIGALIMPALISTVGLRTGLTVIGGAVSILVVASARGLRRIDRVALAPEGLDLLRAVPFFTPLPESVLELLARRSKLVTTVAGNAIFSEGDDGDVFHVIDSGTVDVTIRGVHIRYLGPGDSFGEIALLHELQRTATVVATTDVVTRTIDRGRFLAAVTGHEDASRRAQEVSIRLLEIR